MAQRFSFHHIALSVSDMARSVAFHQQFGMRLVKDYSHEDGSFRIVQLSMDGGGILELFWFQENTPLPPHAQEIATDLRVRGTKHFSLLVDDVHQAFRTVQEWGIPLASKPKEGRTGVTYFFFKDPDGILVEISEDSRAF